MTKWLVKMDFWCIYIFTTKFQVVWNSSIWILLLCYIIDSNNPNFIFSSISMDCDHHDAVFVYISGQQRMPLFSLCCVCCDFLLAPVAYHVTFYSVVEKPPPPEIDCNSLMLYNNVSILNVLCVKFKVKFQV